MARSKSPLQDWLDERTSIDEAAVHRAARQADALDDARHQARHAGEIARARTAL